ncbi:hypothetical protein ACMA5I_04805 [Paracoccaceae bacterium GXU_MW_L88]
MRCFIICLTVAACTPAVIATCSSRSVTCGGAELACRSHAPTFSADFSEGFMSATYPTGPNADVMVTRSGSMSVTWQSDRIAQFEGPTGLTGTVEELATPSCSDGHFFDAAPYELRITSSSDPVPTGPICCVHSDDL